MTATTATTTTTATTAARSETAEPVAECPPSPAGPQPLDAPTSLPPGLTGPPLVQGLGFSLRPMAFNLTAARRFGDVWSLRLPTRRDGFVVTSHPDHLRSLLKADPADAPSLTGESPLRPILGPNSVLTSVGERHMRQRKLLLPPFHGEAVQRYVEMIAEVAQREIDRWPLGQPFSLAPRMSAVTLEVIMRGIFGIDSTVDERSPEGRLRRMVRFFGRASTSPAYRLIELRNAGSTDARGVLAAMLKLVDRQIYGVISDRRRAGAEDGRSDVLSLLLQARDEQGAPLTDQELRDELISLVLAGHETTANSLAWTFERLLRNPAPYAALRGHVRGQDPVAAERYVEATIHEAMRNRPVIPMIVRRVRRPWRFGDYVVPADTPVAVSIIALHHRADVYEEPFAFSPERFLATKPGTYTWIPFGGGIRRCLGATLAMAEQRVVLEAIARRTDLVAPDLEPESPRMRNVTMIPRHGGRVLMTARQEA